MGGEQDEAEDQTLAQRFLRQHRPAVFGSARSDSGDNDQGIGVDNETEEPREADGGLDVDAPEISGGQNVDGNGGDGVPAPRPRAKGVNHPPVPTRAQIDRHALEQHVNYAPWCLHCVQASALMKQHPLVTGDSPSMPTVSADSCFMKSRMKSRDADLGDGIPVLVMRESKTGHCSGTCALGKARPRKGTHHTLLGNALGTLTVFRRTCTSRLTKNQQ